MLRLECSIDCINGSVGHQQNIFRSFSHSAFCLKNKFQTNVIYIFLLDQWVTSHHQCYINWSSAPYPSRPYIIKETLDTLTAMDSILPPSDRHAARWICSDGAKEQQ